MRKIKSASIKLPSQHLDRRHGVEKGKRLWRQCSEHISSLHLLYPLVTHSIATLILSLSL